jgi:DNA-binding LacI/PurR family transcriptional regulator
VAKPRPTISDVAREAGVSKGLVSFALNDRPGVSAGTRDRILRVASELGWRPSVRARSLSTDRAFALGLVISRDPDIISGDPFFPAFIAGIEKTLAPAGQVLVLSMVTDEAAEDASYRQLAASGRVDGLIVTDLRKHDSRIPLIRELGLAAVTLGRPDTLSEFPSVILDDAAGIVAAVDHLIALGHVRIAHVAGPLSMLHGSRRSESFAATLKTAGLTDDLIVETDFTASAGARATRALLDLDDPPTAIVYANDPMAIAGLGVAQRAGLEVPRDLSITGFDGSEVGEYLHPALTTVTTVVGKWGSTAAELLLRLVAGEQVDDIELDAATLLIRESTAPPRT